MKILVVDDDPQISDALVVSFQLQWPDASVYSAVDGRSGIQAFYEHNPDIILLDVTLPEKNGFEVLREIRQISDVPIVMLTAREQEMDQVRALELGADDYVVKPFGHMALIARIKAVLRRAEGSTTLANVPEFRCGDLTVDFNNRRVLLRGQDVKLTPIEYKLLYHLVRNAGRALSHEALLTRVWGDDYDATTDYLKVFISRLRSKIESKDGPPFIETLRGFGYRFVAPEKK